MVIINIQGGAPAQLPKAPLSIALGNFDGVHRGHAELVKAAVRRAAQLGASSAVWTFTSNPFGVPHITSLEEKLGLLEEMGVKYAVVCPFDEISSFSAEEFADLLISLGTVYCVCGFNYSFGRGAQGTAPLLRELMSKHGVETDIIDPVIANGAPVSSTRIRKHLLAGEMEEATALLGRPYFFIYPVTHGNEIGRTIGFPTINQRLLPERAELKKGVYICRCMGGAALTNIGTRPTVCDDGEIISETHIIDYSGDLYGLPVKVEFLSFLREEKKFASLDELKSRLKIDLVEARDYKISGE